MSRDIQSLFISILKNISRQPALHLSEGALKRAFSKRMLPLIGKLNVDIVQLLADYIAEAGRLTDDIIPPHLFGGKTEVCLKNSKISGRYLLKVINSCSTTLVRLDVSGCFQVDDGTLQKILGSCKNLTQLNVKNCRKLTDATLQCLSSGGAQFSTLNIGGNFNLSLTGIESFLRSYPRFEGLKEFSVSGLGVTDDIIILIASKCTGLSSFGMGYSDISESGLLKFFTIIGGQLSKLNLSWHSSVHSTISISFLIECISMYCPKLVELDVSGMKNLNSTHLIQLIEQRIQQHMSNPIEWLPFAVLHAKFISSPKSTVESSVVAVYPGILINC